jgi:hypothetical protein
MPARTYLKSIENAYEYRHFIGNNRPFARPGIADDPVDDTCETDRLGRDFRNTEHAHTLEKCEPQLCLASASLSVPEMTKGR